MDPNEDENGGYSEEPRPSQERDELTALDEMEESPRRSDRGGSSTLLPWSLCGICVIGLLFAGLYGRKTASEANERASQAEQRLKDMQDKISQADELRKTSRVQVAELSGKNEELTAQKSELEQKLNDKDAQLTHAQDNHNQLVLKLGALVKAQHGRGMAKQVAALIAKDQAAATASAKGTKGGKKKRH